MSDFIGMMLGTKTLLVGVEEREDGALKCYVDARWKGLYCLVEDENDKAEVRRVWASGQMVTFPMPEPDQLFSDKEP